MAQTKTATAVTHVGTVLLPVDDQERSIAFYCNVIGLEKRVDVRMGDSYRWVEVAPQGAVTTLALCMPMEGQPTPARDNANCSLNTTDVEAAHAHLKANGVDCDEIMRQGGPVPPMFFFRDPDGNSLLFVESTNA